MELGLLILRVVVGALFAGHGAQKLFGRFGGHGLEGTAGFFDSIGLKPGRFHASAAGAMELVGGLLLALGLLTPIAAVMLIAVMIAAILTVHMANGVWAQDNGVELNIVYIAIATALAGTGAGGWSLDEALGLGLSGAGWAVAALAAGILGGMGAVLSGRRVAEHQEQRRREQQRSGRPISA